ncbi:MAG: hypothetical protein GY821_01800 [Gammaproteobacteria bacterium]|nr:hypothetical protein [Gammaproteobacteria bacterium]
MSIQHETIKSKKKKKLTKKQNPVSTPIIDVDETLMRATEDIKYQAVVAWPTAGAILTNSDYSDVEQSNAIASIEKKITGMVSAMEPRDSHETILMQNMVTAQEWQSKCFLKASRLMDTTHMPTLEYVAKLIKISANFMNLYTKQIETLDKHRQMQCNKAPSRVEVNDGGQAIVGDVTIHQEKKENE